MFNQDNIEKVKKRKSIATEVANQLIDMIISGQLPPGSKLPTESQLCDIYGVGRSSIREAVSALSILELVDVRVPEGTFVSQDFSEFFTKKFRLISKLSLENYNELFDARIAVEECIVKMATLKAAPEDKAALTDIIERMTESINDVEKFSYFDYAFHDCLGDISNNSFLKQILLILRETTVSCIQSIYDADSTNKEKYLEYHTKIWGSLMRGDSKAAVVNMREHLNGVRDDFLSLQSEK